MTVEHTNPIAIVLAVSNAVRSISDKITRLDDPMELLVARSIVRVAAAKKRSGRILAVQDVSIDSYALIAPLWEPGETNSLTQAIDELLRRCLYQLVYRSDSR